MVATRLHDFGRRGGAASQMTGIAHLYNWLGTDTVDAAYAATHYLNDGRSFGACSVLASAHRSTTPWPREDEAYDRIVELFDRFKIISVVADTYGYARGIRKLAERAAAIRARGGWLVARPDSGDPVETTLLGLRELEAALGADRQETGLKVHPRRQHPSRRHDVRRHDLPTASIRPSLAAGFCPSNLVFGMGEQSHRAHRSETELAYKTALVGIDDPRFPERLSREHEKLRRAAETEHSRRGRHRLPPAERVGSIRSRSTSCVAAKRAIWSFCTTAGPIPCPSRASCSARRASGPGSRGSNCRRRPADTFDPALRQKQAEYLATHDGRLSRHWTPATALSAMRRRRSIRSAVGGSAVSRSNRSQPRRIAACPLIVCSAAPAATAASCRRQSGSAPAPRAGSGCTARSSSTVDLIVADRPGHALGLFVDRSLDRRGRVGHRVGVIAADDSLLVDGQLHHAV